MSVIHVGRVDQKEADLIQNELVPQFLGLWIKLNKDGVPAHTGDEHRSVLDAEGRVGGSEVCAVESKLHDYSGRKHQH